MSAIFTRYTLELDHSLPLPTLPPLPEGQGTAGGSTHSTGRPYDKANAYTTPPYPYMFEDAINAMFMGQSGIVIIWPSDDLDASFTPLSGTHREMIVYYSYGPEEVDAAFSALSGTHREMIVYYSYGPEEVDAAFAPLSGTHRNIVLHYLNYAPEELDAAFTPLDGTHT